MQTVQANPSKANSTGNSLKKKKKMRWKRKWCAGRERGALEEKAVDFRKRREGGKTKEKDIMKRRQEEGEEEKKMGTEERERRKNR